MGRSRVRQNAGSAPAFWRTRPQLLQRKYKKIWHGPGRCVIIHTPWFSRFGAGRPGVGAAPPPEGAMSRILLVEDSRTQAAHLQLLLEEAGYTVELAPDAERGLELFNASAFDMVVSDVVMPGQSGYDLCRLLRTHPTRGSVPVVLLTSLNDPLQILAVWNAAPTTTSPSPSRTRPSSAGCAHIFANRSRRGAGRLKVGVEVAFLGRTFTVNSEKEQILDLLVATCEDVVRANRELRASREELARARSEVEKYARRMEGQALRLRGRYRRLMEQAHDAIVLLDTLGRILEINRHAEELFGLSATEVIGRPFQDFVPVEEQELEQARFRQFLTDGHARKVDAHLCRADGQVRDVDYTASLVDLEGEAVVLCIVHDATERRRLERTAAGAEDGGGGAAGRRHRPRLQQPHPGCHRLRRNGAGRSAVRPLPCARRLRR